MVEFIKNLIGNDYWATLIMSFVPLIELKGGIVFARGAGLSFTLALLLAYAGSTAVFFPIYWLLKPILNLLKKWKWFSAFAFKAEKYIQDKADKAVEKRGASEKSDGGKFIKQMGVFIFVAIPIPLTGVWTGTAIAVFLGLRFKDAVLPVMLGNLVAGLIISVLAEICLAVWSIAFLDYILYGLFALAVVLLIVTIVKVALKKTDNNKNKDINENDKEK